MFAGIKAILDRVLDREVDVDPDFAANPWTSTVVHAATGLELVLHCATPGALREAEEQMKKDGWAVKIPAKYQSSAENGATIDNLHSSVEQ